MPNTTTTPIVIIGTPPVSGGGVTATGAVLSIGSELTQLMAAASDMFQTNSRRVIALQTGDLSTAYQGQVGRQIDGITVTQATVDQNQQLLNKFGAWCRANNIGIMVYADLDLAPARDWTHQWIIPAVTAGLPIVAVSGVDEPDWRSPISAAPQIAQYTAAIVSQIVKYYPNVQLGEWVGGSVSSAPPFWTAYNSLAKSLNLPKFSYIEADSYGNTPWYQSPTQTNALYATLSSEAHAAGLTLYAAIRGTVENLSGAAWTAQAEQRIANLARLPNVDVSALDVNSWEDGQPSTATPVNAVGSEASAATMIQATYPLYQQGQISAVNGSIGLKSPQAFVAVNVYTGVNGVSVDLSASDIAAQTRTAIVITDGTGRLYATAVGNGTVTGIGTTTLVLDGASRDINAELKTLRINEPVAGPDSIDIEAFGVDGRLSDEQIYLVAEQSNATATVQTASFAPANVNGVLVQPWTSAVVTSNGTAMVSEVLTWNTATLNPVTGAAQVVKLVSAHLPSAETPVSFGSIPITSSGINVPTFIPTGLTSQLAVQTTTLTFSPTTGALLASDNAFLPLASMTGGAAPTGLAYGGDQITYRNTGDNPDWQAAWGTQFSTATLTYGWYRGFKVLLDEVLQGNESNSFITIENVFDPTTGNMWEQFVTTLPPTNANDSLSTFPSGLMTVTEFNTGDNPNWDRSDWGMASQITMHFQDYYTTSVDLLPPPPMITVIGQTTTSDGTLWYCSTSQGPFVVSGFGGPGDTITVSVNGSVAGAVTVAQTGLWSYALASVQGAGTYKLTAVQTVVQGNSVIAVSQNTTALLQIGPSFTGIAADVSAHFDRLQSLVATDQLGSIVLNDSGTPTLTLTAAQDSTYAGVLGKIASSYKLALTGVAAANAAGLAAQAGVTSVSVSDTAANVMASLASLQGIASGKLGSIALTDSTAPAVVLSSAQIAAGCAVLAAVISPYVLTITDSSLDPITGTVASTQLQAGGGFRVILTGASGTANPSCRLVFAANGALSQEWDSRSDGGYVLTAYDVVGTHQWSSFVQTVNGSNLLLSIDYTMHAGQPFSRTVDIFNGNNSQAVSEINYYWGPGSKTISYAVAGNQISYQGIPAANAAGLATQAGVTSVSVSDTAANVMTSLAALQVVASGKLGSIALTDSDTPTLTLTAAQESTYAGVLGKIAGSYKLTVSSVIPGAAPSLIKTVISGVVGQAYTGETIDYDPAGNVARMVFTGVTGTGYSTYEYDFTGGVFAGSRFTVTNPPAEANYSSYELDYNANSTLVAKKFFVTSLNGQPYTTEEYDFNDRDQLSRIMLNGFASTPYSSLELDYNAGVYVSFKVFYAGQPGEFGNIEEDVTSGNVVTKVIYSGTTTTPYSSVEEDFASGAPTDRIYNFTDVNVTAVGYSASAYHVTENAGGSVTQEVFDLTNGGHAIYAFANQQFLHSEGLDTFIGQSFGNDTFVLNPVYGQEMFLDFELHLSGATHDTIQFSVTEFANFSAMYAATRDTVSGANIVASNGDVVTLAGITKAQIFANQSDFAFS